MKREQFLRLISIIISFAVLGVVFQVLISERLNLPWVTAISAIVGAAVAFYGMMIIRLLYRNPTSFTISLLGFPLSGKTVYLTVLFDELQRTQETAIQFVPYGQETVERVTHDLNTLSKGVWLPTTQPGSVFYYRANASIGFGLFRRRYKIEIADFAGERIGELDSSDEKWLHKSDYFKYVIQSEAVLFAMDCQVLIKGDKAQREEMQNAFVAALQILAESKGVTENRRLQTPIALLFLKADLLRNSVKEEDLPSMIPRLISVCERRCANFRYFFVSSVGELGPQEYPPETLRPRNVVAPIVWILRKV